MAVELWWLLPAASAFSPEEERLGGEREGGRRRRWGSGRERACGKGLERRDRRRGLWRPGSEVRSAAPYVFLRPRLCAWRKRSVGFNQLGRVGNAGLWGFKLGRGGGSTSRERQK